MRWTAVILAFGLFVHTIADPGPDPEPKKYKPETKDKPSKITEEEKTFLREVEAKYGVKTDRPAPEEKETEKEGVKVDTKPQSFPAVIAIEIVNDTEADGKGKRTIDANLGYGYRTNNGYTYTYFGKPKQEQGKFMIYPYSQEDIPSARHGHHPLHQQRPQYHHQSAKLSHSKFHSNPNPFRSQNVEIQPSQAYELVPVTEESASTYHSQEPVSEIKTQYERVQSLQAPPPPQAQYTASEAHGSRVPSTLYSTYNGGQLSGLTGQFPAVMSNYFVDSSQLLQNPQFQSVGLTPDHLRQHGPTVDQRVVPVLVLRIPSSHLSNPSADLYPNLPSNYPLSNYLNNVNLQDLVAQYFKKIGYPHVPQVMTHYAPVASAVPQYTAPAVSPPATQYGLPTAAAPIGHYGVPTAAAPIAQYGPAAAAPISQYETQQYAAPEPTPTYTHTDFSGVQYSAVQPVMARYPVVGQQFMARNPHTGQQTLYEYVQPSSANFRQYLQAEYQQPHYQTPQYEFQYVEGPAAADDVPSQQPAAPEYEAPKQAEQSAARAHSTYGAPAEAPTEQTDAAHASQLLQLQQQAAVTSGAESYAYSTPQPQAQSEEKNVPISENYPSRDHTRVTVVPQYKSSPSQHGGAQSVSYVTPSPLSPKYHPYKLMAPQSVLRPQAETIAYINSHSIPSQSHRSAGVSASYAEYAQERPTDLSFLPPVGSQKPPSYPRNYHAHAHATHHSKRMTMPKQENKSRSTAAKKPDSTEKRPSS